MRKINRSMSKTMLLSAILLIINTISAQNIERIDPPYWWVGMQSSEIELIIKGENLTEKVKLKAKGVEIVDASLAPNPNYLYLRLKIDEQAPPQDLELKVGKEKLSYSLKKRDTAKHKHIGLDPSDIIYLITPDRFANGDPTNDVVSGMQETVLDRSEPYARHGGDIRGIIDRLDYIQDLGMTSLWINPLMENDESKTSYHGYAITDHYLTDPRFGTNETYKELADELHNRDMKLIMDVVYNHIGDNHYFMRDLPDSSFINWWPEYTQSNFRASTHHDPYASEYDKNKMIRGWFDGHMPDLNLENEHLARYMIQNSIWCIEEFDIDAFRIDTYTYPDQQFMKWLSEMIYREYPDFFMFGETWVHYSFIQNYFVDPESTT